LQNVQRIAYKAVALTPTALAGVKRQPVHAIVSSQGEDAGGDLTLPYAMTVLFATTKLSPLPILPSNTTVPGLTTVQCTTATPAAFVFTTLLVPHAMLYVGLGRSLTLMFCTSARAVFELLTFAVNRTTEPTRTRLVTLDVISRDRTGSVVGCLAGPFGGSAGLRVPVQGWSCKYLCAAAACTRP
jgi:hypothetical protein